MRRTLSTPRFKPTLLALLVSTGSLPALAAATNSDAADAAAAAQSG